MNVQGSSPSKLPPPLPVAEKKRPPPIPAAYWPLPAISAAGLQEAAAHVKGGNVLQKLGKAIIGFGGGFGKGLTELGAFAGERVLVLACIVSVLGIAVFFMKRPQPIFGVGGLAGGAAGVLAGSLFAATVGMIGAGIVALGNAVGVEKIDISQKLEKAAKGPWKRFEGVMERAK